MLADTTLFRVQQLLPRSLMLSPAHSTSPFGCFLLLRMLSVATRMICLSLYHPPLCVCVCSTCKHRCPQRPKVVDPWNWNYRWLCSFKFWTDPHEVFLGTLQVAVKERKELFSFEQTVAAFTSTCLWDCQGLLSHPCSLLVPALPTLLSPLGCLCFQPSFIHPVTVMRQTNSLRFE